MEPQVKALLMATRPPTLLVGLSPVILGSAYGFLVNRSQDATAWWQLWMFILALVLVVAMQSAANLVNDVKDAESGIDQAKTRLGPTRAVAAGLLPAALVRRTYQILFALVIVCCLFLVAFGGWTVLALGVLCCLFAYLYTGGPWPLSHLGAGELVALLFFGPIAVAGSAYLQLGAWHLGAALIGLGPGSVAAMVMAINNYRDRQSDQEAGKRTLATRLSLQAAQSIPDFFLMSSLLLFALVSLLWGQNILLSIVLLAALAILAQKTIRPLIRGEASQLNLALKRTTIWNLVYVIGMIGAVWQ